MPSATEMRAASNPSENLFSNKAIQDQIALIQSSIQPDIAMPSVEAPEVTASNHHRSLMTRYQPSDAQHIIQRRTVSDRSSCPPQSLGSLRDRDAARKLKYLDSFSTDILPPPTAPLYLQIITYIQRWGIWAAVVSDEKARERLIQAMAEKMENVWLEGMRNGLIPQIIPAIGGSDNARQLAGDVNASFIRSRKRRQISPSREVVMKSKAEKSAKYAITAGELHEAGVTKDMVNKRVLDGNLDEEEMLADVLEQIDKKSIDSNDWYGAMPRTEYNTMGRDLKMYCLWEMQKSTAQIHYLTRLLKAFKSEPQIRNTQFRINMEQAMYDEFLALALILHEKAELLGGYNSTVHDHETEADQSEVDVEEPVTCGADGRAIASKGNWRGLQTADPAGSTDDVVTEDTQSRHDAGKRPLEADDAAIAQPTKKIKISEGSIFDENFTVPETTTRDFTPATVSSSVLTGNHDPRLQNFIDSSIIPKLNQMLRQTGHQSIANGTHWTAVKVRLREAGIGREVRNQCVREIKKFRTDLVESEEFQSRTQPRIPDPQAQQTFDDLPTSQEIIESMPTEGLSPQEFNQIFKDRADPNDARWPLLVKSVAYMDKAKNRWFALTTPVINEVAMAKSRKSIVDSLLPDPGVSHNKASNPVSTVPDLADSHTKPMIKLTVQPKRELKIILKIKPGFNPQDYSSRQVNKIKGFRWRYVDSSSVAERDSMDTSIQKYVQDRIDFDRQKKLLEGDLRSSMPDRFGTYEVLSHPANKDHSVVHGIWDYRNNPKKVSTAQWFYDGKDGEWIYPVMSIVVNSCGGQKRCLDNAKELEDQSTHAKNPQNAISKLDGTLDQDDEEGVKSRASKKTRSKGKTSKTTEGKLRGAPPPSFPPPSMSTMTKGRKRKADETHDLARPKRRARTTWISYADDNEDGDDDDEYVPGAD